MRLGIITPSLAAGLAIVLAAGCDRPKSASPKPAAQASAPAELDIPVAGATEDSGPALSAAFYRCRNAAITAFEEKHGAGCYQNERARWEVMLDQRFDRAMAELDTPGQKRLLAEQQAWKARFATRCDSEAARAGGSADELERCRLEAVSRRAAALARYNDETAPLPVEVVYSDEHARCMASSDSEDPDSGWSACSRAERRRWDEILNRNYQATMGKLDAVGRRRLRDDQREWLKRQSTCDRTMGPKGGSGDWADAADCLEATARRALSIPHYTNRGGPKDYEPAYSAAYDRCMDKSGGVTSSMRDCQGAEWNRWDRILNRNYQAALARLDAAGQAKLRDEQRRWLAEEDLACQNVSLALGGTLEPVEISWCSMDWRARRALVLAQYPNVRR